MKSKSYYNLMLYTFPLIVTFMTVIIIDYVDPAFYTYDMCSQSYMQSISNGQQTIYDRSNSQELINACYTTKNILLNPVIQSLTAFGFLILTMRYMILGSKKEFINNNPIELHTRFYHERIKISHIHLNCDICRYEANNENELENHLRLTGHNREKNGDVN